MQSAFDRKPVPGYPHAKLIPSNQASNFAISTLPIDSDAFLKLISTTFYLLSFGHFGTIADSNFYRSSKKISS